MRLEKIITHFSSLQVSSAMASFFCHDKRSKAIRKTLCNTGLPQSFHSFAMTRNSLTKSCHCERPAGARQSRKNNESRIAAVGKSLPCNDRKAAFSLVEMLMALLVASLLLAALAPVMTRRMADREIKIMSEAANYDKDTVLSVFTTDTDFNIPTDANQVRVTLMGGGGAGGDANWGSMVITNSQSVTLPEGVTKVRAFLIGGGGGGASGGYGTGNATKTISATEEKFDSYTTGGQYTFNKLSSAQRFPEMDSRCKASGVTKWTLTGNNSLQFAPNSAILRITACGGGGGGGGRMRENKGGGGGSGAYFEKRLLIVPAGTNSLQINVGGYGGYGGGDGAAGGVGGSWQGGSGGSGIGSCTGDCSVYSPTQNVNGVKGGYGGGSMNELYGYGGGAGIGCVGTAGNGKNAGSGSTKLANTIIAGGTGSFGGGNGGASPAYNGTATYYGAGGGGGGGCTTAGGGGGGGIGATGAGGGGATFITNFTQYNGVSLIASGGGGGGGGGFNSYSANGGGGGGGGGVSGGNGGNAGGLSAVAMAGIGAMAGYPGTSGKPDGKDGSGTIGGTISTVFGSNNCNGGNGASGTGGSGESGANGKSGAMRVYYGGEGFTDYIKCDFSGGNTTGGGGGGGGQITVTEISVPSSRTLYFKIGEGGKAGEDFGKAGHDGGDTSIHANNASGSRLAIANGGSAGLHENAAAGSGGGVNIINNWTGLSFSGGQKGDKGYSTNEGASLAGFGGKGGNSQYYNHINKEVITVYGGTNGGNAETKGGSPKENPQNTANGVYYGAGGGGGHGTSGTASGAGLGGDGGSGYVYIEWGGSNGGGGTAGELVQKIYTNIDASNRVMKIRIGRGGGISSTTDAPASDSTSIGSNGNGGITSVSAYSGGKEISYKARGGIKGKDGKLDIKDHGESTGFPNDYSELYKQYVQGNLNLILGEKGTDDYGGTGGYLACIYQAKDEEGNTVCTASAAANDGSEGSAGPVRPGCGGTAVPSPLYDAICRAYSSNDSANGGNGQFGGGGGGGAVLNNIKGIGGKGGNGFVILEYKSTRLD